MLKKCYGQGLASSQIQQGLGRDYSGPAGLGTSCRRATKAFTFAVYVLLAVVVLPLSAYADDPALTVVVPNGGETYILGGVEAITWTSTGDVGENVRISVRKGSASAVVVASTPNSGSYTWNVPSNLRAVNNYVIEISSVSNPAVMDSSDGIFALSNDVPPVEDTIVVLGPNGGENYQPGSVAALSWTSTGSVGSDVSITLRKGGVPIETLSNSTPNDGAYDWSIPGGAALGSDYAIEVRSTSFPAIGDTSDGLFTLSDDPVPTASISVVRPNGGEIFARGTVDTITWSSTGAVGDAVKITIHKGSASAVVVASTPNDGVFEWNVPTYLPLVTKYTIQITSISSPEIGDASDNFFGISDEVPPVEDTIAVLSPNGGENYLRGSVATIGWTSTGVVGSDVSIALLKGGAPNSILSASTSNDGSYDWAIPGDAVLGTDYAIEIRSIAFPAIGDSSNGVFTLSDDVPPSNSITVLRPNGGENFVRGSVEAITWESSGSIGANVRITAHKGTASATIAASTPNDGTFDWSVPGNYPISDNYVITIASIAEPSVLDSSDAPFSLSNSAPPEGTITVISPNGGEIYARGTTQAITWSSTGTPGANVTITVHKGATSATVASQTANDGHFDWLIPNYPVGSDYLIQIKSATAPSIVDSSDSTFSLTDLTPPVADFTISALPGEIGDDVSFFDASQPGSSPITAWLWNFGDGIVSTTQNPTHAYTTGGTFSVSLTVTSAGGSHTATKPVDITHIPQEVDFALSHRVIRQDYLLNCFNYTVDGSAPISSWLWSFGDGGTSTDEEPDYAYATAGQYTVSLTATSAAGEITETKVGHVMVLEPGTPVIINEFVASNRNGLLDEDGKFSDWIELYNATDTAVSLLGWGLTDDDEAPGKWLIPDVTIEPAGYLVIFASGEDRFAVPGELHTNFKLDADGEYVALFPDPNVPELFHGYAPREQRSDVSYGLVGVDAGLIEPELHGFMVEPTPGALNAFDSARADETTPPLMSHIHGHYATGIDLNLAGTEPGTTIYYTEDGSLPSQMAGTLYAGPIPVTENRVIRAIAYAPGYIGSKVVTATYIIGASALEKSLPALCVVGDPEKDLWGPDGIMVVNGGYYDGGGRWRALLEGDFNSFLEHGDAWERKISLEYFDPLGAPESPELFGFQQDCGIRIHGSQWRRTQYRLAETMDDPWLDYVYKKSFRYYFRDEYGESRLDYPLIPNANLSSLKHVVMRAGTDDAYNPFVKDEMSRRLMAEMGNLTSRGSFVHFYLNGYFKGYYNPVERYTEDYFQGAYDSDSGWDIIKGTDEAENDRRELVEGDWDSWFALNDFARDNDLSDPTNYATISTMLDIDNFIDYLIMECYGANFDWPRNNWYMARERSSDPDLSRWRYYVWDMEMCYYAETDSAEDFTVEPYTDNPFHLQDGWTFLRAPGTNRDTSPPALLYQALRENADFRAAWEARANVLLAPGGILGSANVQAKFNALYDEVNPVLQFQPMNTFIRDVWAPQRPAWLLYWFGQEGLMPVVAPPAP